MKKILLAIFFLGISIINAQTKGTPISIGNNYTIPSKVLNQDKEIQIYLPKSYTTSKIEYPVLYILDGQRFFTNGVAIQKSLRSPNVLPEMIIVGVNSTRSTRRSLFRNEEKYTSFLKEDVIQFIDTNFRTNKERIIFGWEAAAYYISKIILTEKDLFTGAIITDGGLASEKLVQNFNSEKEIYLYMSNSKRDIYYIASSDKFNERLKKHNPKNLTWKYELFNEEVHQSMPHLALYKGIQYYYYNYDALVFENIQSYVDAGGLSYLKSYIKGREKRFGSNKKIDESTQNSLIWLGLNRDNFEYFCFFMKEFKDVLKTKRYQSAYWKNKFGQFYLKYKDYKSAKRFFKKGIEKYPNSRFQKLMEDGLLTIKEND